MHWTYKYDSESDLEQGDILQPSQYVSDTLKKYHPYYIDHPDNQFYMVLTQSCDLVRRGGVCKSPYITIAPVRPLRVVIAREFEHQLKNVSPSSDAQPYGSMRVKSLFNDFLGKLFNNNDHRYFYLREQQDKSIAEDMCAITSLSISVKIEHYCEFTKARVLQLDDLFQAKLGWLVGQRYSKVGTPDWDERELSEKVEKVLRNTAIWVEDGLIKEVDKLVKSSQSSGKTVDLDALTGIVKNISSKKNRAIDAIFAVLVSEGYLPEEPNVKKRNLRQKLSNDAEFSQFFS